MCSGNLFLLSIDLYFGVFIYSKAMIFDYAITVFFTQLVFIGCRTWNVRAISLNSIPQVLLSGAIVHLSWLVSIAIGVKSTLEIIDDWKWEYLPIVVGSLSGGLIGSYITMKMRIRSKSQ